jgi:hypothetical protein
MQRVNTALYGRFLHFRDQTTNVVCVFLLINRSLNEDKEPNLTTNHKSPMTKRFANYAFKTGAERVLWQGGSIYQHGRK